MGQGPAGVADRLGALRLTSLAARSFAVGALLSLGVWGVVAYRFSGELARVEARAEAVTGRYTQAQEVLSTLRAAALKAERAQKQSGRHAQEFSLILTSALRRYTPIWDSPSERVVIDRLRRELDGSDPASLVAVSEELQSLNRASYLEQQSDLRVASRRAEARLHRGLNTALMLSLLLCAAAAIYATRIETRLERQRADEVRYTSDLQRLSARVVAVQEEERRSIARDLHDEVGQALAAIKVELASVDSVGSSARSVDALQRARSIAEDAVRSVRDLSHLLHPPLLEELGLMHALEHQVKAFGRRHGIATEMSVDEWPECLSGDMEQAIYRIVQEALNNVAKHSRAQSCRVALSGRAGAAVVTVTDNGVGFSGLVDGVKLPSGDGLGLVGIRERAACFGGAVTIANGDSGGGVVSVVLPVVQASGPHQGSGREFRSVVQEVQHERSASATRG